MNFNQHCTFRDWFAGQALIGLLSNGKAKKLDAGKLAKQAYEIGKAMEKARAEASKGPGS